MIKILKQVIYALEHDYITYDWNKQESCNCGLIAQAILNITPKDLGDMFSNETDSVFSEKENNEGVTWKRLVQKTCNVTGLSNSEIIKSFSSAGFRPEDVIHLEYMENVAILKEAKINVTDTEYYAKKENLILYLKAWVKILETGKIEDHFPNDSKENIEKSLLIAVQQENFEKAATLRDLLTNTIN